MSFFKKLFNKKSPPDVSDHRADSLALYSTLCGSGNFIYSPYSIVTAIGMAYAGARGETRKELIDFFGQKLVDSSLQPKERNDENLKLQIANSIFPDIRFQILPDYSKILEETYLAECRPVDFVNDPASAEKTINQWVSLKTDNHIRKLVNEKNLAPDTSLVIVNAIYFNCKWENEFDAEDTVKKEFYSDSAKVECSMMNITETYSYLENKKFQAIEIPYKGGYFSMLVFLPVKGVKLSEVEKEMNLDLVQKTCREMQKQKVYLSLPKFKHESTMRISSQLKSLGVKSMFTYGSADFSGIDGTKELFVGEIIQKAFIEVEEEGTKAAAATALVMRCGSAMTEPPKRFNANHPFFYAILDNETSTVLFAGKVMNPEE